MQKIEEQLGKVKIAENDVALKFANKIQKMLCRLRKQKKIIDKKYFQIYPLDPMPPRLYGTITAHKPEKNYCVNHRNTSIRNIKIPCSNNSTNNKLK